jgi:DNA repair protein RecN (Recombination protein N)
VTLASELSDKRRKAALKLSHSTLEELAGLGMERAGLQIAVDALPMRADGPELSVEMLDGPPRRVGPRGMDRVDIRISANPGEEMKPLSKVASGGELSRVLLALKRVLASKDPVPVYVFDEVDAGVGGSVGEAIGIKIRGVSEERQALCVTHLPQIAAQGDHHLLVEKQVREGRTTSIVRPLALDDRVEELARMLGGRIITDVTRANAREMLVSAQQAAA